jgi:HK97 family phage portal protein
MGLWHRLFGGDQAPAAHPRDPADDYWYGPAAGPTSAGQPVTIATAYSLDVVKRSVDNLMESIAPLPGAVFERVGLTERRRRDDHPLARLFRDPNPEVTSFEFLGSIVGDLALHGNFYGEMLPGPRGPVDTIWRLEPDHVTIERLTNREVMFRYREPGLPERRLSSSQVWQVRRLPLIANLKGSSPIDQGRETISTALALRDYAAKFFRNDATPPYWLKHPGNFKDEESKKNFLAALRRWLTGPNRHTPAVFEYGIEPHKLGTTNEEAQFLETRAAIDEALARLWHMPPHKVGILARATNNNIEQQALEYVVDTLTPWLELIEASIDKHLMIAPDKFFFEFNVSALLRGDVKTRFEAFALGRQWGWLSVNEVRSLENMNGIGAAGDIYADPPNVGSRAAREGDGRAEAIQFLRESVGQAKPNLRLVKDAA